MPETSTDALIAERRLNVKTAQGCRWIFALLALGGLLDHSTPWTVVMASASVAASALVIGGRRYIYGRKVIECAECGWQILASEPEARQAYGIHWEGAHGREVAVMGGAMTQVASGRWVAAIPEPFVVRERGRADW